MKLRQLEHVSALAEYRNFHRAADAVGLTQPALTHSIRTLEEELGVELFERTKRDVRLTAFGSTVLQCAHQTLSLLGNLKRELDLMKNLQSGRLVVACNSWIAEAMLSPALGRMLEVYPKLRFSIKIGAFNDIIGELLNGSVDLYLGTPPEARDDRFQWHDIALPSMLLLCNPNHPLLALERPSVADCLAYPIAGPPLPRWYLEWINSQLGRPRTHDGRDIYSYFLDSDDFGTILQLVTTTDTICAMLPSIAAKEISSGRMRALPLRELEFSFPAVISLSAQRQITPAGNILLRELIDQSQLLRESAGPRPH
jgi:DNA-binding transcriptional LysR family regulator